MKSRNHLKLHGNLCWTPIETILLLTWSSKVPPRCQNGFPDCQNDTTKPSKWQPWGAKRDQRQRVKPLRYAMSFYEKLQYDTIRAVSQSLSIRDEEKRYHRYPFLGVGGDREQGLTTVMIPGGVVVECWVTGRRTAAHASAFATPRVLQDLRELLPCCPSPCQHLADRASCAHGCIMRQTYVPSQNSTTLARKHSVQIQTVLLLCMGPQKTSPIAPTWPSLKFSEERA